MEVSNETSDNILDILKVKMAASSHPKWKRSAERERYQEDPEKKRSAKRKRYWESPESGRLAKRVRYGKAKRTLQNQTRPSKEYYR